MTYIKKMSLFVILSVLISSSAFAEFVLESPADSSECVSNTYTFEWGIDQNLVSFNIEVAYDSLFSFYAYRRAGLAVNSHEVTLPFPDSTYYWRVKATDVDDNEIISDVWMFKTSQLAPEIVYPLDQTLCVQKTATVKWREIMADSYEFEVFADSARTDTVIHKTGLTDTSYTFTVPEYHHKYFWRVNGNFDGCISDWSEMFTFTSLRAPAVNFMPGQSATGIASLEDDLFKVRFQWDHIDTNDLADFFTLQVSDTTDFSRVTIDTMFVNDKREIVLYFPLNYNMEYFWRVKQNFEGCGTEWSEPTSFKLQYEPVTLIQPADSAKCTPIVNEFRWLAAEGASKYTLQISDSIGFDGINADTIYNIDTVSYIYDLVENMSYFFWRVRAEDENNIGLWSETRLFMTKQSPPEPVYPADSAEGIDKMLTLRWQDKGSEANYDIKIASDEEFENILLDTLGVSKAELSFELPDFNESYYWQIRVAYSDSTFECSSDWSDIFEFRTQLQAPQLISPADSSVDVPLMPRFEWSEVETAEYYEIAFAKEPDMEYIIIYRDSIPNTTAQIAAYKFDEHTDYYWMVRATNSAGKSMWSDVNMFTTGIDKPEKPLLISPANTSKKLPLEVNLVWHSEIRASQYRLQVATDQYFSDNVIADTILTDTTYVLSNLTNYVVYHWRVQSINEFGVSDFTSAWNFRTIDLAPTEAPVLFTPKNNSVDLKTSLSLTWSEVPNAYGYEVQVATDDSFDAGSLIENSRYNWDPAAYLYELDYLTKYYWRVRGWSEAADGPWSDVFNFTTESDVSVNDGVLSGFDAQINPNPVTDRAELQIQMPVAGFVKVEIFDIKGNKIDVLLNRNINAGIQRFDFSASNYAKGTYIIKLTNGNKQIQGKFIVE